MVRPTDRAVVRRPRLAAATLIVEQQIVLLGQMQHLRKEIPVICAGSPVKQYENRSAGLAISSPIERNGGGPGKAGISGLRDRERHDPNLISPAPPSWSVAYKPQCVAPVSQICTVIHALVNIPDRPKSLQPNTLYSSQNSAYDGIHNATHMIARRT